MDEKTVKLACDYINENATELHSGNSDVGLEIRPDDVVSAVTRGSDVVLVVDRGIKGSPKYSIPLDRLPQPKAKATARVSRV